MKNRANVGRERLQQQGGGSLTLLGGQTMPPNEHVGKDLSEGLCQAASKTTTKIPLQEPEAWQGQIAS